tara:strand:- start:7686 stop:8186 length:501 start_codon:yes stop_codon:yes gene_type:complete
MKKIILTVFVLLLGLNIYAQRRGKEPNRNSRITQTQTEPTAKQIEKRARLAEKRKREYIDNFLTTLEADEPQKNIIKQKIMSFIDAKTTISNTKFENKLDQNKAIENLENIYFLEFIEIVSESDMAKIKEMTKGEFDDKSILKKNREVKKKRRKEEAQKKKKSQKG